MNRATTRKLNSQLVVNDLVEVRLGGGGHVLKARFCSRRHIPPAPGHSLGHEVAVVEMIATGETKEFAWSNIRSVY